MQSLLVLGSTGSIGTQTLDVVRASGGALKVSGLAAARSHAKLLEQVAEFAPRWVALADESAAAGLEQALPRGTQLCTGPDALARIARECEYDTAVHGIVGAAGLVPSLEVIRRGKKLALANKESLVMAGALLMPLAEQCGSQIVPVDSEHSAIHQCLRGERVQDARRVILTASGGPFRRHTRAQMQSATCADALKHPTWTMGRRITIGSATLMNKALEVIELAHLFGLDSGRIDVVIHPQSIVHSLVEFVDGSVLAQLGLPDMRVPIHYAIHWPQRAESRLSGFDLAKFARLEFEAPDRERFPALAMGYRALELGGCAGAVLNAADEVAVEAFLAGKIGFMDMAAVQSAALEAVRLPADSMETVLRADQLAREHARASIARLGNTP